MLAQRQLDEVWSFDDPQSSEHRLRARADTSTATERAEWRTQIARALGLQGRFENADAELDALTDDDPAVVTRVALERGRLRTSEGEPAKAIPHLLDAAGTARAHGLTFLEVDALHMLAIADTSHTEQWTLRGLSALDGTADSRTRRWAVALHNNFGWTLHDAGRFDEALAEFERAHATAELYGTVEQLRYSRWSVARCLRSLGRMTEARSIQRELLRDDPTNVHAQEELALLGA